MLQPTFKGLFLTTLSRIHGDAFHTRLLTDVDFASVTIQLVLQFEIKSLCIFESTS